MAIVSLTVVLGNEDRAPSDKFRQFTGVEGRNARVKDGDNWTSKWVTRFWRLKFMGTYFDNFLNSLEPKASIFITGELEESSWIKDGKAEVSLGLIVRTMERVQMTREIKDKLGIGSGSNQNNSNSQRNDNNGGSNDRGYDNNRSGSNDRSNDRGGDRGNDRGGDRGYNDNRNDNRSGYNDSRGARDERPREPARTGAREAVDNEFDDLSLPEV